MTTGVEQLLKDLYGQSPNGYGNDIALLHLAQEIDAIGPGGGITQLTGDGTAGPGSGSQPLAVTKTGGVAFAPSATTDTTNASNISSGTLNSARLTNAAASVKGAVTPDGNVAHFLDGTGAFSAPGGGAAPPGTSALIASAIGVDLNTAGDTAMTLSTFATGKFFVVDYVLATNPSSPLTAAAADVWSGANGTGQKYSSIGGDLSNIQNPRDWITENVPTPTMAATAAGTAFGTMQNTAPLVNVATPEGSAATADFYVYGRVFT